MAIAGRFARLPSQMGLRYGLASSYTYSLAATVSSHQTPALSALARYYASKSFPPHSVVSMPALSPTMTSGNVGTWHKKPGDPLTDGDVLVEIETDKAQMDFVIQEDGVLAKILKETGEKDVAVGAPIAVMIEEGGDVSAFESFTIDDAGGEKTPPKEAPKEEASESSEPADSGSKTAPPSGKSEPAPEAQESESSGARLQTSLDRESKISPSAKKLALEKGVPIGQVKGTGKGGQITKEDIEKYKGGAASPAGAVAGAPTYEDTPATSMRKTIANRLTQSVQQNPHYFVNSAVSVTKLLKLRQHCPNLRRMQQQ